MAENKERIACIKPDCKGDLNPLFEKHLKGYCMPCFDAIEKAARDLYIKNNIRDLNPFQNISDKVEILLTVFNYQQFYDPLINLIEYPKSKFELVAEMTEHELRKLSQKVSVQLKSPNQKERLHAVEIANLMAGLTNFDLDQLLLELLDVPESGNAIFRRSGSMVIEELLLRLQEGNTEVLLHLAFVDNESVTEKLISLLDNEESKIDN